MQCERESTHEKDESEAQPRAAAYNQPVRTVIRVGSACAAMILTHNTNLKYMSSTARRIVSRSSFPYKRYRPRLGHSPVKRRAMRNSAYR